MSLGSELRKENTSQSKLEKRQQVSLDVETLRS